MKKVSCIFWMLLTLVCLSGCNKWLEIEPEDQASDDKVFKDYVGFRNALNGIYEMLSKPEVYGREMSWGFVSALAQTYNDVDLQKAYPDLEKYKYEMAATKSVISGIWSRTYNAIANCNKLIAEIETRDTAFFPYKEMERNLILGEALALRGFLHLDMLRLFAPAPSTDDDGAYIPYFTVYPSKFEAKRKTSEVLKLAADDLKSAQHLVAEHDTLRNTYSVNGASGRFGIAPSGNPNERFFSFRGCRMNYFAVTGILARLYMYAGDLESAKREAAIVYRFAMNKKYMSFTYSNNLLTSDAYKYSKAWDDILFAFYDKELIQKVSLFRLGSGPKMLLKGVNEMFEGREDGDDYRKALIATADGGQISQKWLDLGGSEDFSRQYPLIPVIRLSEICYILSEVSWDSGDKVYALSMLNYVRGLRGAKRQILAGVKDEIFRKELMWEGIKEYLTEGQTFFMFKRMNVPILSGTQEITMGGKFVLPLPENENIH